MTNAKVQRKHILVGILLLALAFSYPIAFLICGVRPYNKIQYPKDWTEQQKMDFENRMVNIVVFLVQSTAILTICGTIAYLCYRRFFVDKHKYSA